MEDITIKEQTILAEYSIDHYDMQDIIFDDFIYDVQHMIDKMRTKKFFCYGLSLTWRNVAGYTEFETTDARTLIDKITPNTDFSIKFLKTDQRGVVEVITYHHDAPTGETMYLMSQHMAKKLDIMNTYFN